MKSELMCIPCFLNQAIEALALTGVDTETRIRTMKRLLEYLHDADLCLSPPELSMHLHAIIREETCNPDPYLRLKKKSTDTVRALLPKINILMGEAEDTLSFAIKLGAIGNVIDYGVPIRMDVDKMIDRVEEELTIFDIQEFRNQLEKSNDILFLGDNAGEIILDTFLLRVLKNMGKKITYGVREGPIINDATREDAIDAGIPDYASVITTGSLAPGTLLDLVSPELLASIYKADLIISKGQGNFESLSADPRLKDMVKPGTPVFFLLTVKCSAVGEYAGVPQGSTIFKRYYP